MKNRVLDDFITLANRIALNPLGDPDDLKAVDNDVAIISDDRCFDKD